MEKEHDNEIKRLKRERLKINVAISDFERLEASQDRPRGKPPMKAVTSSNLIQIKRKSKAK
jgi:hypothetical protein